MRGQAKDTFKSLGAHCRRVSRLSETKAAQAKHTLRLALALLVRLLLRFHGRPSSVLGLGAAEAEGASSGLLALGGLFGCAFSLSRPGGGALFWFLIPASPVPRRLRVCSLV